MMNNISIIKLNMNFISVCLEQLQFIKNKILFKTSSARFKTEIIKYIFRSHKWGPTGFFNVPVKFEINIAHTLTCMNY